jgi:hypothetical protein
MSFGKPSPQSLCIAQFKGKLVRQIRTYWYVASAAKFSERWWKRTVQEEGEKGTITHFDGVSGLPFRAVDLTPSQFLDAEGDALDIVLANAIVAVSTAVEVYLTDVCRRAVYLKPGLLEKSEHKFTSGKIGATLVRGSPSRRGLRTRCRQNLRGRSSIGK